MSAGLILRVIAVVLTAFVIAGISPVALAVAVLLLGIGTVVP